MKGNFQPSGYVKVGFIDFFPTYDSDSVSGVKMINQLS